MMLQHIPAHQISSHWAWMAPLLEPSIAVDPDSDMATTRAELEYGDMSAWRVSGGVLLATTGRVKDSAAQALWVVHAGGTLPARISDRLIFIRSVISEFEAMARSLGCDEIRIEGRISAWGRALPDFERHENVLRKVL